MGRKLLICATSKKHFRPTDDEQSTGRKLTAYITIKSHFYFSKFQLIA